MGSVQFGTGEAPLRRVIGAQPDDRLLAASSRQMHNPCATLATPTVAQTSLSSSGQTYKNGSTKGASPGRRYPERAERQTPTCIRRLGKIAIVDPDNQWWRELNLGSPEAIIKVFVQQSGCFDLLNRGRAMQSRATERAVADNAELKGGSNLGNGQVKSADYFLEPNIVTANHNSGGGGAGAVLNGIAGMFGGLGRAVGAVAGGINVQKGKATVTLSVGNARTTEEEALLQSYARKSDVSFSVGGCGFAGGAYGGAAAGRYHDTAADRFILMADLDAYIKLVTQLGDLPSNAAAAAPRAK